LNIGVLAVDLRESWKAGTADGAAFWRNTSEAVAASWIRCFRGAGRGNYCAQRRRAGYGHLQAAAAHQGKLLTMNVSITPLVSKSGDRIGRLLLFDDVTQRERMKSRCRRRRN